MTPHEVADRSERLPAELRQPFKVAMAKAVERMPGEGALPGGTVYEPKWDGFRLVIARDGAESALWSRQRKVLTRAFPEIVEAASLLIPPGIVVDGEVVRWNEGRLDFDALLRRLATSPRTATSRLTCCV
jgi:ATP-dependent DNA ligase